MDFIKTHFDNFRLKRERKFFFVPENIPEECKCLKKDNNKS